MFSIPLGILDTHYIDSPILQNVHPLIRIFSKINIINM